jgi:ankyrin repeat protein
VVNDNSPYIVLFGDHLLYFLPLKDGRSALMYAARGGYTATVQVLLDAGTDRAAQDKVNLHCPHVLPAL